MKISHRDLEQLKNKLLAEEKTTSETLASFATKTDHEFTSTFPAMGDAQDEDAHTTAVEEYGTRLSTERALEDRLRLVRAALARVEKGAYGACTRCGKPIPPARLEASPEAELCGKCK